MSLNDYADNIRSSFWYLFEKYKFDIKIKQENWHGYYRVGLQSPECKILFVREQAGGVMFFGSLLAPFDNEDDQQWCITHNLLAYFAGKKIDSESIKNVPYKDRMSASLTFVAKELEPYCSQLIEKFQPPEYVAQWKPKFDQYMKEKI